MCMRAVLCVHYFALSITLHRNFMPIKQSEAFDGGSISKAVLSARSCIALAQWVKNVVPMSHHLAFFIQQLFGSAVILLLTAMHTQDGPASNYAIHEAASCIDVISEWEGHWPGATKCKELLNDLITTARNATQTRRSAAGIQDESQNRVIRRKPKRSKSRGPASMRMSQGSISLPPSFGLDSALTAEGTCAPSIQIQPLTDF